jgi:hypothetical protein
MYAPLSHDFVSREHSSSGAVFMGPTLPRVVASVATALLLLCIVLPSRMVAGAEPSGAEVLKARTELRAAVALWLHATVTGDFAAQSAFYPETMDAFYLQRNVPKSAVLAEKRRVFDRAQTINIDMETPQILLDPSARSARMYFRKTYVIKGNVERDGEVLQELRWVKDKDGWKIVSERDLRIIRPARRE